MQTRSFFDRVFRVLRYTHALFGTFSVLLVGFILVNTFVLTYFRVDGHSMEPTLQDTQLVPVCLICVHVQPVQVGDVVIVDYAGGQGIRFVKRVLGVPGSTVSYNGGKLVLGTDQYFVVGDNRDHSTDSRVYGPILRSQIRGVIIGNIPTGPGPL